MIIKMGDDILIRPAGVPDNGVTSKDGTYFADRVDTLSQTIFPRGISDSAGVYSTAYETYQKA